MFWRFSHGENRRKADVGALHDLAPFLARLALENLGQRCLQFRPGLAVHLRVESGIREPGVLAQQSVELRLDRSDQDEIAASALVDPVDMRASIEKIPFAPLD